MKEILLEIVLCLAAAACLMIFHESVKVIVYTVCRRGKSRFRVSPWKVWRYIDPVGLILAVTSYVPVSRPYFFRIRDQRTNRLLGIAGLLSLVFVLTGCVVLLRRCYGGLDGISHMAVIHWWERLLPMFLQYLSLLSFGMLVINLFPVSTFDMGLLLAGFSSAMYLRIIKSDGTIKMIVILVLLLDLIRYGAARLLVLFL